LGAYSWDVGFSGAVFGVANHTILNVYQIMLAANKYAVAGQPWGSQAYLIIQALAVFKPINGEFLP